ncbi:MAG: excinuclease ABC subunit UvrC [Flavobacteriales bacterium]|nr:excinuclease ABC subunit UvrC [Flavobacteriales bacterium]
MTAESHIESILKLLPHKPGVYQYFDKDGVIIYVGKAKDLKNRVSSYFNKQQYESGKTLMLVRRIVDIKYIVVETELDALLLENSLIKKYKPKYNINLKDDKTYPSIVIRHEPFPRIFPTRNIEKDGSEYHGPYASVKTMHAVLDLVKKLYQLRTCSLPLTEKNIAAGKFKVCLEYHLGNCKGPCEGKQTLEDYEESVAGVRKILKGNYGDLLRDLRSAMNENAANYAFEMAQDLKEKIETLENFQAKSTIVNPGISNVDVFTIASDSQAGYVNYMKISNGVIIQGYTAELKKKMDESDMELLEYAIITIRERFQSTSSEIYVPFELELQIPDVEFHVPQRGDKKKLLDLSLRNSTHFMLDAQKQQELVDPERHVNRVLETMQKDLHLQELPRHIECFDNSNIQGTNPVSACVVFKNAKPSKQDYRIFNPKTVVGPNDFDTMKEVVYRRYKRLMEEGESLPQLIIIDGGKGQLGAALESLGELGLRGKIAIIGIAKRLEEIYFPGDSLPIYLDKRSETLRLIQHLRDEAHRFGITKHRNKRSKDAIRSELTEIKGIGFRTTQALIVHFKTVNAVKEASLEQLEEAVNKKAAAIVYQHFHGK